MLVCYILKSKAPTKIIRNQPTFSSSNSQPLRICGEDYQKQKWNPCSNPLHLITFLDKMFPNGNEVFSITALFHLCLWSWKNEKDVVLVISLIKLSVRFSCGSQYVRTYFSSRTKMFHTFHMFCIKNFHELRVGIVPTLT